MAGRRPVSRQTGAMTPVSVSLPVAAPPKKVWDLVADLPRMG